MNILVTDGENRSALAVTRSLGKRGYRVVATGSQLPCLGSSSRFCTKAHQVPDPKEKPGEYALGLQQIIAKEKVDIIFPITDVSVYLFNSIRKKLPSSTLLACPPADKMAAVSDKLSLFRLSEKLHVPIPRTFYIHNGSKDLDAITGQIKQFPVVVKPAFSKILRGNSFLSGGIKYAASQRELEQIYATSSVLRYPSMIQEKIVGPGTGLFTLFDKNRHLVLFSHKRLLEKPPSGGVSVVSESVPIDPEMEEISKKLLSSVGWQGVAMVEFKRDLRDGKPKLIEINGRFWGSLQLAISAGVDFPVLLLKYLQGEKILKTETKYKTGLKLKWLLGTLDHLIIRLKNKNSALHLPPEYPSKLQSVIDFLKIRDSNAVFDVFDKKDIKPFIVELKQYVQNIFV